MGDERRWREWRTCEFCGCYTNAKARACCDRGRDADQPATPPEPAAPCIRCGATGVDMTDSGRCFDAYACWRHRPTVEPDEAERWASTQAERWLLDSAHGGMLSEDRGYVEALGHDHAHLATLLRAAEARGRERGIEEAARECDQLAGIAERGPWPGRRHEYTSAAKRIRALRSGR